MMSHTHVKSYTNYEFPPIPKMSFSFFMIYDNIAKKGENHHHSIITKKTPLKMESGKNA
jgi:hypothetical protein